VLAVRAIECRLANRPSIAGASAGGRTVAARRADVRSGDGVEQNASCTLNAGINYDDTTDTRQTFFVVFFVSLWLVNSDLR
jgi:hypothetical protein